MRPPPATVLAVLLLPVPARLQGPATLVLDIQPQPVTNWLATGDPNWYGFPSVGQLGNLALFSGRMPYGGRELFVSDGSPFGARLLKDIDPGPDHSHPHGFTELPGGIAVFVATERFAGPARLWRTDGTTAGTQPLGASAATADVMTLLTRLGSIVLFAARTPDAGVELWASDGTGAGTRRLTDINPGSASAEVAEITRHGNEVVFVATDGQSGRELWRSDGTTGGTVRIKDIAPGSLESSPAGLLAAGPWIFFSADDGVVGRELWRTDGTFAGTQLVKDIRAGPGAGAIAPQWRCDANGVLFFVADDGSPAGPQVWRSDGSAAGTVMVGVPGTASAAYAPAELTAVGGRVFFRGTANGVLGLWVSDGTAAGTFMIHPRSNPEYLCAFAGRIWFADRVQGIGVALWSSDGTMAGTSRLDLPSAYPGALSVHAIQAAGPRLWITVDVGVGETLLFTSDGTSRGTWPVNPWVQATMSSDPDQLVGRVDGTLAWFTAWDGIHGRELWSTDGTAAGTNLVADIRAGSTSSDLFGLTVAGQRLFFSAMDAHGYEPWVSDGTVTGTHLIADLQPGYQGSLPLPMAPFQAGVLFGADLPNIGRELCFSDGTAAGTRLVKDIVPGVPSGDPLWITSLASIALFGANSPGVGNELWVTDGTTAGTRMVLDIDPGARSGAPEQLTRVGQRAFFSAFRADVGQELWSSDGTAAGTRLVADLTPGTASSSPYALSAGEERLWFLTGNPGSGTTPIRLWCADAAGTRATLLHDFGVGGWPVGNLVGVGTRLFFLGFDAASGREPWTSDGTPAGTHRIVDLLPGPRPGATGVLGALPDLATVLFLGSDGEGGQEIWASDGTLAGTVLVQEIGPGPFSCQAEARRLAVVAGHALFGADDGLHGIELWRLPLAAVAAPFGSGCPGTGGLVPELSGLGGPPGIGNARFALGIARARPGSAALCTLALARRQLDLGNSCTWLLDPARSVLFLSTPIDAAGAGLVPLPIPFDPSLRSGHAFVQSLVADPAGAVQGLFAVSNGLSLFFGAR